MFDASISLGGLKQPLRIALQAHHLCQTPALQTRLLSYQPDKPLDRPRSPHELFDTIPLTQLMNPLTCSSRVNTCCVSSTVRFIPPWNIKSNTAHTQQPKPPETLALFGRALGRSLSTALGEPCLLLQISTPAAIRQPGASESLDPPWPESRCLVQRPVQTPAMHTRHSAHSPPSGCSVAALCSLRSIQFSLFESMLGASTILP